MKNHIKSLILITAIALQSCNLTASRNYAQFGQSVAAQLEGKAVATAAGTAVLIATQLSSEKQRAEWYRYAKSFIQKQPHYRINHYQLESVVDTQRELPTNIQQTLQDSTKPVILFGAPGTGKTDLAYHIAYQQGGLYSKIHQAEIDEFMQDDNTMKRIIEVIQREAYYLSNNTPSDQTSTLHLEELNAHLFTDTGKFSASFKELFEELARIKNVKVIITTNHGINAEETYSTPIKDRAHIIQIHEPGEAKRIEYLTHGCTKLIDSFNKQQTKHNNKYQVVTQTQLNDDLKNDYLVTDAMIKQAQNKHNNNIANKENLIASHSKDAQEYTRLARTSNVTWWEYFSEFISDTKASNDAKRKLSKDYTLKAQTALDAQKTVEKDLKNLKRSLYNPSLITINTSNASRENEEQFAQATEGMSYRSMDTNIIAPTYKQKLDQIEMMKERLNNPTTAYKIDTNNRTCTVTHNSGDYDAITQAYTNTPKKVTYNFGEITTRNMTLAAQKHKNQKIVAQRKAAILHDANIMNSNDENNVLLREYARTTTPAEELSVQLPSETKKKFAQELIPTNDLTGLVRKATLTSDYQETTRKKKAADFKDTWMYEAQKHCKDNKLSKVDAQEYKKSVAATKLQALSRGISTRKKNANNSQQN